MIVITGALGFIGSVLTGRLNHQGNGQLILVDDFSQVQKNKNLGNKAFVAKIDRGKFFEWFAQNHKSVEFVFHIGARTDTTEFDKSVFDTLNLNYSKRMWQCCSDWNIPMLYASSAATYGMGEHGYFDDHQVVSKLKPLNPYGESKNDFDKWALHQKSSPTYWFGMKFFNVYGPNEYHKGRMASVILHAYNQMKATGKVRLFRSHHPDFKDGDQFRDFIYVMDVADVLMFMMESKPTSGLYNLGTGKASSFNALARATFAAAIQEEQIEYIDTPLDIRDKYQYFTEAKMDKLRKAGYTKGFSSPEEGVGQYVRQFLSRGEYY
ncbi:MAG: ADP-glyceromanno-heptose 6-epimerase [Bacteroidales bacterium]|nr:ADP-glyceromanno-heptose 6-epimerase [Bacteroidales bacterium]MDZ4203553.1 ADP-glyceromanno-heptose 6-epimerase [Bacteroidales bacterium]